MRTAEETEEKYVVRERRNAAAAYRRFRGPAFRAADFHRAATIWKLAGAAIALLCALGVIGWLAFSF